MHITGELRINNIIETTKGHVFGILCVAVIRLADKTFVAL
jgi:hypothetical protein